MQQSVSLTLEPRTERGSRAVRKMRAQGQLPAVVYGHNVDSQPVSASYHDIAMAYQQVGKHSPLELQIDGKKRLAMVKRADVDPLKHRLQHVAFYVVKQNEKVQTEVAVRMAGEEDTPAEKAGLVLIKTLENVQIEALPRDLVEVIEFDGAKLESAGDSITVADLSVPKGITILSEPTQQIISVVEPAALAAANEAADEAAETPDAETPEAEAETAEGEPAAAASESAK